MPLRLGGNATAIKNAKVNTASNYTGGTDISKIVIDGAVKWEKVTASFDGLTGASPTSYANQIVIAYEDNVTSPGSPTKTGYSFTGWSPTLPRTISADTTFTAQWSANSFNITLNANGGTAGTDTSIAVVYNTSIDAWNANHMPSRAGYSFNGFYTATSGGTKRINSDGSYADLTSTTYTSAATLYAQWTANSFNITLDANGGTAGTDTTIAVVYATSIDSWTANHMPSKTGYTFNGFYTATSGGTKRINSDGSYADLTSTTYTSAATLYAQWTANSFNITLDANTGTAGTDTTIAVVYATSIDAWTANHMPSKTGYTFNGFYTATSGGTQRINASGTYVALTNTTYTANAILYAQWTPNSFNITLDANGGTAGTDTTIAVVFATSIDSWTANHMPSRTGHTFNGFYTATSGGTQRINASGTYVALTNTTYTANAILYAQWTIESYTIDIHENPDTGSIPSITQDYGTAITAPTAPTRTGYTFANWYNESGATTIYTWPATMPDYGANGATKHVYVGWTIESYTINTVENGGSPVANISGDYGSTIIAPSDPTRTGYSFGGWYNEYTYTTTFTWPATMPDYGATGTVKNIFAKWIPNSFDIILNPNGGSAGTDTTIAVVYNTSIDSWTANHRPSRTGYTFNGFYTATSGGTQRIDSSGTYVALTNTTYSSAATLYAQWTAKSFSITLNANGGTAGTDTTIAVVYNTSIDSWTANHMPSRTGYTFNGFYTATSGGTQRIDSSGTYVALTNTTYSSAATLYAQWAPNSFNITLDANTGTAGTDTTIVVVYATYIDAWTANHMPSRTGYTFNGFYTATSGGTQRINSSGTYVALTNTTYTANAILYAQWTPISITITLNANGGTAGTDTTIAVVYNTSIDSWTANHKPSKTGYAFNGFYTSAYGGIQRINSSGTYVDLTTTTYTTNTTLYALWTAKSFSITLNATSNGGVNASNSAISVTYNTTIESFKTNMIPYKAGYKFKGYYTSTSGGTQRISPSGYVALTNTTYAASTTLYAQFTYAVGLTSALISVGAQNDQAWRLRENTDLNAYLGQRVRLVIKYTSGSYQTGDVQFDDFNVCGTSYDPEDGVNSFQRNSNAGNTTTTYSSISFEDFPSASTTVGKFNRYANGTATPSTGMTSGYTGSYYLYAETSGSGYPTKTFWLRSPYVTATTGTLSFYSAQYGATCGPFEAYLEVEQPAATVSVPDIINYYCWSDSSTVYVSWTVKNNDPSQTVTIYTDIGNATPEIGGFSQPSVGPGLSTSKFTDPGYTVGQSVTIYAKAGVGAYISGYDSQLVILNNCPGEG